MNKSLKVLIVEDEEYVRNLLKASVDWEAIGLMVAGEASSGCEALDALDDINPDIIITDIRMPFMDGLEFSGIVAERHPHVKVIILTAYEEFEYARKGIKIGIADFLLKPVNGPDLKNALMAVIRKIEAERISKNEFAKLKERLTENYKYLKERFLYELIHKSYSEDEIIDKISYFSLEGYLRHAQAAVVELSRPDSAAGWNGEENALLDMACADAVSGYFGDNAQIDILTGFGSGVIILSSSPDIDLVRVCEQLRVMISRKFSCDVCIGIGNPCNNLKDIKKSYKEACDALSYKVVYGRNQVICHSEISVNTLCQDNKCDEISGIGFYVKVGIDEKAVEIINGIFNDMIAAKSLHIDKIRVMAFNIVTAVLNSVSELGMDFEDIFESKSLPYNNVLKIATIPEMKHYLNELVRCVAGAIKTARTKKSRKLFNEIIAYIQEHISEPGLTLSGVANAFYLNPSYLSRTFRQETGYTFVEYLSRARIEKAVKLLNATDLRAYEIGERVGIPDPNYFGKCFKKYTGMSINEYRKSR